VDVRGIPGWRGIQRREDGALTIGAATCLTAIVRDARVLTDFPLLARACGSVGTYQLRNMGTIGGNLCQRPRCVYFRHGFPCLKAGGSICSARSGDNTRHAIFQTGHCVAAHPSDPAVALTALDATLQIEGPSGRREIPLAVFFEGAGDRPDGETVLAPGELIASITLPAVAAGGTQYFEKLMQRGAWDFATVSLGAARRADGDVRIVLGGVASRPWRVTDSIEEDVASGGLTDDDLETLAQRALYDAQPLSMNRYKMTQAAALLRRGMRALIGMQG
jgi:xanthine dehydrogenase YagS FAD-binding subunit